MADSSRALLGNRAMFTLDVEGSSEDLGVVRFTAHEAISALFELRVEVASATPLPLDGLIDRPALLTIEGLEATRYIHGVICEAAYIGETSSKTLHELVIVPELWKLHQRSGCRIFQQKATPEVITDVLKSAAIPADLFRLELQATYTPRDYCVQYRETDLDFISRLMEADGIYYYFEHTADKHVMVLTDLSSDSPPIEGDPALQFTDEHDHEHVSQFRLSEGLRPQRVSLRDKNLHKPGEDLEVSAGAGAREIYDSPGGYQAAGKGGPGQGGQQAKLRLEALQATRRRGYGVSDSPRLAPGYKFTLADATRTHLEGEYRLLTVVHRGEQPQALDEATAGEFSYASDFQCSDASVPFRAPRLTPRPTVHGSQTATVTGPAGEEIHVDEHGRVKVQFHWDRQGKLDESSACWVRVSQAWAGNGFGAMFIPRIGHEVIVDFLEGDPDRPIVTGRIYTGFNTPPYPLPDEKTKSTIKSESSPGGGGSNELRFEDLKGGEEIYLHGQKDWNIVIENDKNQKVGHDETLSVGNDRTKTVGHDESETIVNDRSIVVGNMHDEKIGVNMTLAVGAELTESVGANMSTSVGANSSLSVGASKTETVAVASAVTIGAAYQLSVGGAMNESIGLARMEEVGAVKMVTVGQSSAENVGGGKSVTAGGNITESAGKNIALSAGKHVNVTAAENVNVSAGKKLAVVVGDKLTMQCGDATITVKKNGDVTISAKKLSVKASGDVTVKGSKIKLN
jgi:type VI secretion system secreted protein VgrG